MDSLKIYILKHRNITWEFRVRSKPIFLRRGKFWSFFIISIEKWIGEIIAFCFLLFKLFVDEPRVRTIYQNLLDLSDPISAISYNKYDKKVKTNETNLIYLYV